MEIASPNGLWDPQSAYDQAARGYDQWSWQRVWREVEGSGIERALPTAGSHRILDIGCGTGSLLRRIHNHYRGDAELVGLDVSSGMLEQARLKFARETVEFIHGDLLQTRFKPASFDAVFMCRVASHLANLEPYFDAISNVLRPGGILVLSDVHNGHPYECTRLPVDGYKISVKTHKHAPAEILGIASHTALMKVTEETYGLDALSTALLADPELPASLREQAFAGASNPFGFLVVFQRQQLRTHNT